MENEGGTNCGEKEGLKYEHWLSDSLYSACSLSLPDRRENIRNWENEATKLKEYSFRTISYNKKSYSH